MTDKSARQRILDTMTGRERITDDFMAYVRVRDLHELLREHDAQAEEIRDARETLAYIDMTLALPMYQNAISGYGEGAVETLKAIRKLLTGGMHPDTRARLHTDGTKTDD